MRQHSRTVEPAPATTDLTERLDQIHSLLEEVAEDNTALVARLDQAGQRQTGQAEDALREIAALRSDLNGQLAFRALRDLATELIGPLTAIDAMLQRADFSDPVATEGHVRSLSLTLSGVLSRLGAERVPIDVGAELFDPSRHRCVGTVKPVESPFPDAAPRTIVRIVQDGYLLHGRPLTPATVEIQAGDE
ncbi:nucleotide exchange factor GrpE [Micromonospora taraxaci]